MTPRLNSILETCLYVDDIGDARRFYEEVMGLAPMAADDRFAAYGVGAANVLLIFRRGGTLTALDIPERGTIPPHDGAGPQHFAFAISHSDVDGWRDHLMRNGLTIEGEVRWQRGGHSLYVRDPDGHLLELASPGLWDNY